MIILEKYRDKWLAEKVDDYIGFYTREFYCLDNFSAFKFNYKGKTYLTVEHAYQSLKFKNTDSNVEQEIINSNSPYDAKKIAYEHSDKFSKDFDRYKVELMEELLRAKLEQNPYVKQKLLETKDYLICEDSPIDNFWGIGNDRKGQNIMGKLWMKIRDEISVENKNQTNKVIIYTDGACSGNPGIGGWGAILFYKNQKKEISGYEKDTTNNKMELTAAIEALSKLKTSCEVDLYSDSAYLINAFNEGWVNSWILNGFKNANKKEVANIDLWKKLIEFNNIHKIKWIKVKGHADNEFNNRCDELATGEIAKNR